MQDEAAPAYARGAAAKKLGQIGSASEHVIDALVHTLQHDADPMNRGAAANALGQIGSASEHVIDALVHTLRADNVRDDVRGSAANALRRLDKFKKDIVKQLLRAVSATSNQGLRTVFARTLWAQAQQAVCVQQDGWVWERIQHALSSWPSEKADNFAHMLVRLTAYTEASKPLVRFSPHAAAKFAEFATFRQRADQEFAQMMQLSQPSSTTPRRVLLITVTENEQRTVLAELKARGVVVEEKFSQHWQGYSLAWRDGEMRSLEGYLVRQDEQRATDAASRLKDWLNTLQPDAVLMVGMCLGLPDQLKLGDVVAPSEVVSLAHVRETPEGAQSVPHVYKTRDMPMRRVQQLLAAGGWPEDYRISTKQLGCSSIKLENPDGQTFQALLRYSPDVVAYEMEGEGFFHALKDFTGEALLIKGVADHGDFSASQELTLDEKARQKAEAQAMASSCAFPVGCSLGASSRKIEGANQTIHEAPNEHP